VPDPDCPSELRPIRPSLATIHTSAAACARQLQSSDRQRAWGPMDTNRLKGMAIVSVAQAARLGTITDILFEREPLRVAALQVRGEGVDFVIPFEQIRTLGTDAVTVDSSEVTQIASTGGTFDGLPRLTQLLQLKVVDDAGTLIGTLQTVELDPADGRVQRLVAHRGGMFGVGGASTTIAADAIRSVGGDILTVAANASSPGASIQ
jgi:sporulation protein YlmC with PRC-barrel domain